MPATSPARQLNLCVDRFDPAIRKLVRAARIKLRRKLPTALELVYDNYNALAIGFASSERGSDTFVSLAVYARGVNLYTVIKSVSRKQGLRRPAATKPTIDRAVRQ